MNKTKLLLINGNQFGYSAGHYYYCKYLKDKYDIQYICYDRGQKKMLMDGVNVHYIPFNGNKLKRILRFLFHSIRLCRIFKPDIVFVVYFDLCSLLAFFCRANLKVLDIRTGSLALNSYKRNLDNLLIRIQANFFDRIFILSDSLKQKIKLNHKHVRILPLGAEIFYSGRHDFNRLNLLYVGAVRQIRNIHKTIEGVGIFLQKNPEFHSKISYSIVGFGGDYDILKIKETIDRCGLGSVVIYEGHKNYEELPPYFEKSNIGVAYVPITDYFNCQPATKTYEYALSGLFTIATSTYENKLSVTQENGILCNDTAEDFAEALEVVSKNLATISEERVRDSLKNNCWSVIVAQILEPFFKK